DGLIIKWLAGAEALFGWRRAEALGRPLTLIVPEHVRERYVAAFERAVAGDGSALVSAGPVDIEALRKDGSTFPAELTLSRGELDGNAFFVGVVRDVTSRRAAEIGRAS